MAARRAGVFATATAKPLLVSRDVVQPAHRAVERRRVRRLLAGLVLGALAGGLLLLHAHSCARALPGALRLLVLAPRR